jgi:hypothetical protein
MKRVTIKLKLLNKNNRYEINLKNRAIKFAIQH